MPKITRILIFLFLNLSLNSCVFLTENTLKSTVDENNFLNRFAQNQKSIVIFKIKGSLKTKIYLCEKADISDFHDCRSIRISDQYHILMIKPANYYLFASQDNAPIFQNKDSETLKHFGIFKTKAGELLYVGDVSYRRSLKNGEFYKQSFSVKDRSKFVKQILSGEKSEEKQKLFSNQTWEINHLIERYSSLRGHFQTRLLQKN